MERATTTAAATTRARPLRLHDTDPGPALETAFLRIEREAMAGLPLLNKALRVQAVGFERWQGQWLGALVTPWFVNLVLVPGQAEGWAPVAEGERRFLAFGAGDFAFLGGFEPEVGEFQACSLISPPGDFERQADAVECARIALRLLHEPPAAQGTACGSARGAATGATVSTAQPPPPPAAPPRRVFMFGRAT